MYELLIKLIKTQNFNRGDIEYALYDICENEHSSCNLYCPVYEINNGPVSTENHSEENRGCICCGNGKEMYDFVLNNT